MHRTVTVAALVALLTAPMATLGQAAEPIPAFVQIADASFDPGQLAWTSNANARDEIGWHMVTDAGRTTWYAAQVNATGVPGGYPNNAVAELTSPIFDATGFRLRAITVVAKGSSQPDLDVLKLQFRAPPTGEWKDVGQWSGTALEGAYAQAEFKPDFIQGGAVGQFQLRLVFTSDAMCDWTTADDEPVTSDTPPAPNPEFELCQLPDDPEANPEPPGDRLGWFVDAVRVDGFRIYAPVPGAQVVKLPLDASAAGTTTIDLGQDAGKFLDLRYDESGFADVGDVASVAAILSKAGERGFTLALARDGTVWSGLLAVDEPDLVAGAWTVSFAVTLTSGSGTVVTRNLVVTSGDTATPTLTLIQTGIPVRLGPNQYADFQVSDATLRRVTYQFPGMPTELETPFPYALPESALPEGPVRLTVRAYDRAGHISTLSADIDRDTTPPALTIGLPATFYAGVPTTISLDVGERTPHSVRLEANGTALTATGTGGSKTHLLTVTPNGTAPLLLRFVVIDAVGNRATFDTEVPVVPPVTDTRIRQFKVVTPTPLFAQNPVHLVATLEQLGGVTELPVTIRFTEGGFTETSSVLLPRATPRDVTWNATLGPGRHTLLARVEAPAFANETDATNQNATLDVEVFLGSVRDGNRLLVIRADSRGLPAAALVPGSSKTYPLELVNSGRGVVYRVHLDDNATVDWDPLSPIAPATSASTSASQTSTDGGKDAPFPGLLLALAALALSILTRRRLR